MEKADYVDAIRIESARLIEAAESAGLAAPVPTCPEWTVADLLGHVGTGQWWEGDLVARAATERERSTVIPPDGDALFEWMRNATRAVLASFTAADPDTPMWTLMGPGKTTWWLRRQAHEVALHRVDAQLAAGGAEPIAPPLARDGIAEFFENFVPRLLRKRFVGDGETVHLQSVDEPGDWSVRLTSEGPEVGTTAAAEDVVVRGTASDLLLVLRSRASRTRVDVAGDVGIFDDVVERSRV